MKSKSKIINLKKVKKVSIKNLKGILNVLPILISVIMLIAIANALVPEKFYTELLTKYELVNSLIMDFFGGILAGNPINAYIISKELLKNGFSLFVITTFILSWTTVGIIQFPAESILMGKKFALYRNLTAFVFAIIVSITSVVIYEVIF